MTHDETARRASFHHLYFTAKPDPQTGDQVLHETLRYSGQYGLTARPTSRERLHVSLNSLGGYPRRPAGLIGRAIEVASTVRAPPFLATFDRIVSWRGDPRPLVLVGCEGVIGFSLLHAAIHEVLACAALVDGRKPDLNPHMTLLRDPRETPEVFIQPVTWRVREFLLIDSLYGQGRHVVLGRWRLIG